MRKLSLIMSLAFASVMLFTTSCGSPSTPGDVSVELWKNVEKGNYDDVIDAYALGDEEMSEEDRAKFTAMLTKSKAKIEEEGGIKSIEIIEEEINEAGDEATVKIKIIYGNDDEDTEKQKLVLADGKWKATM